MDASDFWWMYVKGHNKQTEDRAFLQWLATLPYITDKNLLIFKNYYDHATGKDLDKRTDEEILADIEDAMRRLNDGDKHF